MKTVTGVPAYDEMYAGDAARAPQAELHSVLARLSPEELHDRARLRDALEGMRNYDIGGLQISYSATDHTGLDFSDLSIVNASGKFMR